MAPVQHGPCSSYGNMHLKSRNSKRGREPRPHCCPANLYCGTLGHAGCACMDATSPQSSTWHCGLSAVRGVLLLDDAVVLLSQECGCSGRVSAHDGTVIACCC